MSTFEEKGFPRKFRNFVSYRLACFAKNGEKFFFTIRTFFDCYTFKLINDIGIAYLNTWGSCPSVILLQPN
ncbi:hypothetical protein T11_3912 [Trichinella zimbabwensis]|uniref:Uncharacterized protein n=1 Tax=Trichinella zimbabwensis TaxID=268475 RepID=A0A0V1GC96_9BILA|nr:hypothetical protein T11_2669 [Trichinella zimbabwensis]KRY98056.1 hypothetical protein T11_3912 [Trichinella zimbabwensis]